MVRILPCIFCLLFCGVVLYAPSAFSASPEINALIKQDEIFFLQNELKKANAFMSQRDLDSQKLFLEKEGIKKDLASIKDERDLLQKKVETLQRTLVEREQSFPDQVRKVVDPFQERIDALTREQGILKMAIDEKNRRINDISGEGIVLQAEIDNLRREKTVLMTDLKKVRADFSALKEDMEVCADRKRDPAQGKIRDLEARLAAEKTLTGEKIRQAQKPLQDEIGSLKTKIQMQDMAWQKKMAGLKAVLEARIRTLEGRRAQAVTGQRGSPSPEQKTDDRTPLK